MSQFIQKYDEKVTGTLCGWDRGGWWGCGGGGGMSL